MNESGFARIAILKVDIEGAEAAVFASNYAGWIGKVDNIVIELHGPDCRRVFESAISLERFRVSQFGEFTVCNRLS